MEENDHGNRDVVERQESADESNRAILPLLQAPGNLQIPHRVTNFFIDNILRPDFGRRKDAGANRDERESLASRESHNSPAAPQTEQEGSTVPAEGTSTPHTAVTGSKKPAIAAEEPLQAHRENGDQCLSSDSDSSQASSNPPASKPMLWPAWVYCTRYSDRPSSGWCWKKKSMRIFSPFSFTPYKLLGNLKYPVTLTPDALTDFCSARQSRVERRAQRCRAAQNGRKKKTTKFDLEDLEKTEKYLGKKLNVQAVKCTNSLGWVESKRGGG